MISLYLNNNSRRSVFIVLLVGFAVYCVSLANGFVWDDHVIVVPVEAYRNFDLKAIFLTKANSVEYLPVRDLSLAIDYQLWGAHPFGFHLTSLLLYMLSIGAVYGTARRIAMFSGSEQEDFVAFWTALIFAVHPLHAEPLNFITNRNTLLAGLFLFLSFNVLIDAVEQGRKRPVLLSACLFFLSLFSKATVVFYPLFLALFFLLTPALRLTLKNKVILVLAFLAIDALAVAVHFKNALVIGALNQQTLKFGAKSLMLNIENAVLIPFFYLKMMIPLSPLSTVYSTAFLQSGAVVRLAAALGLLSIALLAWILRKRHQVASAGIGWFLLSLIPVLNLFPTFPVVADRYAYLPVFGFGLTAAYGLNHLVQNRRLLLYAAWALVISWSIISITRSLDWRSDVSLWESAIAADPTTNRLNLAEALWSEKKYAEALTALREEHEMTGTFRYSQFEGKYALMSRRYAEAIGFFRQSLNEGGNWNAELHIDLAEAYEKTGNTVLALEHYLKGLEKINVDPFGQLTLIAEAGSARMRSHLTPDLDILRVQAEKEPGNFALQEAVALAANRIGMYVEAEHFHEKALELNPASWEAWYNLGVSRKMRHDYRGAVSSFDKASSLNRLNPEIYNNTGACLMQLRKYADAERNFIQALRVAPTYYPAAYNLGSLFFLKGDAAQAKKYFAMAQSQATGDAAAIAQIRLYQNQLP